MDFAIDKAMREALEGVADRGRTEMRPIGLESDRLGRPIPAGSARSGRNADHGVHLATNTACVP